MCLRILLLLVVAGCGVRVEVMQPPPTATPRTTFVDPVIWDGDVVRQQASPRFVFAEGFSEANLFHYEQLPVNILVYSSLYMPVYYNVVWFGAPQSTVQLTATAFRRADSSQNWTLADTSSKTLSTASVPYLLEDALGVGIYADAIGQFEVRLVISAVVRYQGGGIRNFEAQNEFLVFVLPAPEELSTDLNAPLPFDIIQMGVYLYDARGWYYGPCSLAEWVSEPGVVSWLNSACNRLADGNTAGARSALMTAREQTSDTYLRGLMSSLVAMLYVADQSFTDAYVEFSATVDYLRQARATHDYAIALCNLMATLLVLGDFENADSARAALAELQQQIGDEGGAYIRVANEGQWYDDYGMMEQAYHYFTETSTQYAAVVGFWINR
jgi:hypothetical protein